MSVFEQSQSALENEMAFRQMIMAVAAITASWLFVSEPAAAQSTSTWTTCAQENQLCSFSGTRNVRYGANGTWTVRQTTASGGGVQCSNSVFGDPVPGVVKSCQLESAPTSTAWTFCANEFSLCAFTGTRRVRYGADSRWVTRDVTASNGGVSCTNRVFGDPAPNVVKRCDLAATSGTTQQPPTLSGTPASSVTVGSTYRFQPTASDANGDRLAFTITNRPSWTTFSTTTGLLTGQPTLANVGSYSNINISVSDGTSTVRLPAFSINVVQNSSGTATLSWTPPTANSDGTTLTNLAGYRIYYGTSASALTQQIQLANPGLSTYVVSSLARGTYYFSVRAYNTSGVESTPSNVVSKTIP
jgi:hypothetical protein